MTADEPTQPLDVAETGSPAEWADVARRKYEHYRKLCDAYEAGGENAPALVAIDVHERHLAEMVPQLVDAIDSLDVAAELAQARAVIDATRQMAIDANARLRAQLLAALDREDDGRTPLSTYVSHLAAQRDALKWSVGKAADEEERLRTDLAFAREEAKSIYDTCKQIERERDTMREVAQGARQAYELKVQDLARETARLGKLIDVLALHGHHADDTSSRCVACSICRTLREVTGQEAPPA